MATKTKESKNIGFAVIETGGKQYLVKQGDGLKIERLKGVKEDGAITFDKVLLLVDGKEIKIGDPYVSGAKVSAKLEGEIKGKKVTILRYKSKTRYKKKKGHRQIHSKITITEIK